MNPVAVLLYSPNMPEFQFDRGAILGIHGSVDASTEVLLIG
jgi:hypothetical protein